MKCKESTNPIPTGIISPSEIFLSHIFREQVKSKQLAPRKKFETIAILKNDLQHTRYSWQEVYHTQTYNADASLVDKMQRYDHWGKPLKEKHAYNARYSQPKMTLRQEH